MPDRGNDLTTAEGYKAPVTVLTDDLRPTVPGVSFEMTFECSQCHLMWKENEMVMFNGKRFGKLSGLLKRRAFKIPPGRVPERNFSL